MNASFLIYEYIYNSKYSRMSHLVMKDEVQVSTQIKKRCKYSIKIIYIYIYNNNNNIKINFIKTIILYLIIILNNYYKNYLLININLNIVLRKNNQNMDSALLFNNLFLKLQSKV